MAKVVEQFAGRLRVCVFCVDAVDSDRTGFGPGLGPCWGGKRQTQKLNQVYGSMVVSISETSPSSCPLAQTAKG